MLWERYGLVLCMSQDPVFIVIKKESLQFHIDVSNSVVPLLTLSMIWHEDPSEDHQRADDGTDDLLKRLDDVEEGYAFLQSPNTGSPEVLELAKTWYDDCCKNHPACEALSEFEKSRAQWNPTRLLDIGTLSDDSELHLVESRTITELVQYTALSHCWGNNRHLRLLQNNINDLMNRVDPNTLSKTFRDAIKVTRYFALRYIWIDSLCIIQDSKEDWEAESTMMDQVYRHCECCIAATAACDGTFGCFVNRDTRFLTPLRIPQAMPFKLQNLQVSQEEHKTGPGHYEILNASFWMDEVENGALTNRGWAFQERVLSHRILHFGKTQIFWECRKRTACESFPADIPSYIPVLWREELIPTTEKHGAPPAFLARDDEQTSRQHAYKFWKNALQNYADRLLTVESDKLPAVSGVAKHVQQAAKDDYFAGLWGENMERDLLWRLENRRAPPKKWTAPTWSWACRNGSLNLFQNYSFGAWSDAPDDPESEELAAVLHVSATPAGQDPTGQVSEGHVILCGQLAPAILKSKNREVDSSSAVSWTESSLHVFVDGAEMHEIANSHNCFPDEPVEDEDVLVYCLPIIDFGGTREYFITGLMLKPVDEIELPGVFYRYGIFQTGGGETNMTLFASAEWWCTQTEIFGQPYIESGDVKTFLIYLV